MEGVSHGPDAQHKANTRGLQITMGIRDDASLVVVVVVVLFFIIVALEDGLALLRVLLGDQRDTCAVVLGVAVVVQNLAICGWRCRARALCGLRLRPVRVHGADGLAGALEVPQELTLREVGFCCKVVVDGVLEVAFLYGA
jgi:hypothetical protein